MAAGTCPSAVGAGLAITLVGEGEKATAGATIGVALGVGDDSAEAGVLVGLKVGVTLGGTGVAVAWPPVSWMLPCRLVTTLVSTVIWPLASTAAWAVMFARSPLLEMLIGWPLASVALARLEAQVPLVAERTAIGSDWAPVLVICSRI